MKEAAEENCSDALLMRIRSQRGSGKLDLSLCEITNIPLKAIRDHSDRANKDLDLSYNHVRYLKPLFVLTMKHLTKLNLARNQLQKLPDNFGEMEQLTYLDVHGNELKTLPLSMGEMYNLCYLNISENPFRAPISIFLENEMEDIFHADVYPALIIEFLRGLTCELSYDNKYKENLKIRRRRKSHTFQEDFENNNKKNSTSKLGKKSSSNRKRKVTLQNITQKLSSSPTSGSHKRSDSLRVIGAILITIVVILMLPLLLVVTIESSFLDILTQDTLLPASIWSKYKPYHCYLQNLVNWCLPHRALIVRGPTLIAEDYGIFSVIRNGFKAMFEFVMNIFG